MVKMVEATTENGRKIPALVLAWWVVVISVLGFAGTVAINLAQTRQNTCDIKENREDIDALLIITSETRIDVGWIRDTMERDRP